MMNMMFKQFMNTFIREGIAITDAEKTKNGFIDYYLTRLDEEISSCKNPSEPSEDINNLFTWGLGKTINESFANSYHAYPSNEGWSITKHFSDDNNKYFWTRRKVE